MPVVLSSLTVSSFTCPWIWVIREVLGIHQIFFMSKWATNIMVNTHAVTIFVPGYEKVLQPQPSCWGISRKQVTPPHAKWGPLVIRIFKNVVPNSGHLCWLFQSPEFRFSLFTQRLRNNGDTLVCVAHLQNMSRYCHNLVSFLTPENCLNMSCFRLISMLPDLRSCAK